MIRNFFFDIIAYILGVVNDTGVETEPDVCYNSYSRIF